MSVNISSTRLFNIFHCGVVLVALAQVIVWFGSLEFLFSSTGLFSNQEAINRYFYGPSLLYYFDGISSIYILYISLFLSLLAFLFRIVPILSGTISFILLFSFLNKNFFLNYGGSDVLRILILFDLVIHIGKSNLLQVYSETIATTTVTALRIQVSLIYLSTFLTKYISPEWRSGRALTNILNNFNFSYIDGCWLVTYPTWGAVLTGASLLTEIALPFLILNNRTRFIGVIVGIGFHCVIGITMNVHYFSTIMIIGLIGCLINLQTVSAEVNAK